MTCLWNYVANRGVAMYGDSGEEESYEKGGIIVTSHPSIVNAIWDMLLYILHIRQQL